MANMGLHADCVATVVARVRLHERGPWAVVVVVLLERHTVPCGVQPLAHVLATHPKVRRALVVAVPARAASQSRLCITERIALEPSAREVGDSAVVAAALAARCQLVARGCYSSKRGFVKPTFGQPRLG